jgi:hypothetical protein
VEQQFAEIALGFRRLELRVRASVGKSRLREAVIVRRNDQVPDSTDLLVDVAA